MNRCDNCIYFIAEDAGLKLPRCGRLGIPLALSTATTPDEKERFFIRIGSECKTFEAGPPSGTRPAFGASRPVVGIPLATEAVLREMPTRSAPNSCGNCKWAIPAAVVMNEFGFHHLMCGAKAELIPATGSTMTKTAAACDMGNVGPNRTSTSDVMRDARFSLEHMPTVDIHKRESYTGFDPLHHSNTDPREWVTEIPVTEAEAGFGIRAWRLVHDPKGNKAPLPMPIFDWAKLTLPCPACDGTGELASDEADIDCVTCDATGAVPAIKRDPRETYGDHKPWLYVDHSGLLFSAAFMMMGGMREGIQAINKALLLEGEAGTGKTEFWCYFAWLMDLPFHRLSLRPDTDALEFFGKTDLVIDPATQQTVTTFKLGRFTKVYGEPGVICLDEPNAASDSIWYLLRPALDSAGQLVIESEDRIFTRHPLCFLGLAANPAHNPAYRGTRPLSPADFERVGHKWVDLPDIDTERQIIRKHCHEIGYVIPETLITKLLKIAVELRDLHADDPTASPWGIRLSVAVATYTWGMDLEDAFRMAILDGLDPESSEPILGIVRANS